MGYDGELTFNTSVSTQGFKIGIDKIGGIASSGLKAATAIISTASATLAAMGGYAIKVGSEFEASMSKVAAISGATSSELDALTEKAKEMGALTKFSASESAEAFQYMAMAGWDLSLIHILLRKTMRRRLRLLFRRHFCPYIP